MAKNDKKPTDQTPQSEQTPDDAAPGGSAPFDQGENGEEMSDNDTSPTDDERPDDPDRGPIDPITNQPLSDFIPSAKGKDKDRVDVLAGAQAHTPQASAANRAAIDESMAAGDARDEARKEAERNLKQVNRTTEEMMAIAGAVNPAMYTARERARVAAEAHTLKTDTIRPGGEFIVNGQKVDAFGEPIGK